MSKLSLKSVIRFLTSKAGIAVEVATVTAGITVWIMDKTHEAEIHEIKADRARELQALTEKTSSIHRRLGDSDHFDVRKLVIRKSDFRNVPDGSCYFEGGSFYAPSNSGNWRYSVTTCRELCNQINGEELQSDISKVFETSAVHCWRKSETLPIRGSSIVSNAFSLITVQKIPIDELKDALGLEDMLYVSVTNTYTNALTFGVNGAPVTLPPATKSNSTMAVPYFTQTERRKITTRDALPGDAVGVLLADALEKLFLSSSMLSKELSGELVELQKLDNVLYGQFRYTLRNVTVNGVKHAEYYCFLDSMVVGLSADVYIIVAFVPTSEPTARGQDFQWISDWYKNFAIVY